MKIKEFIKECQENGIFKHLSIYIVSCWVLLQVMSVISNPLSIPKITTTYILLLLLLGFPLYIFLLWKYRIHPSNIEELAGLRSENLKSAASSKSAVDIDPGKDSVGTLQRFNTKFRQAYFVGLAVIGTIAVSVAVLIVKTNIITDAGSGASVLPSILAKEASDKIAILNFDNNTGDEKYDVVGKMAVDWIMHGITQNKVAQVISPKIIDDYTQVLKASLAPSESNSVVTQYLKPSKVIVGNFYLKDSLLLFQSSVMDANMDQTEIAFKPVDCDSNEPLDCIEALKQRILGYLITEEMPSGKWQESPPNFEAYQNLLNARARYRDPQERLRFINAAIAADDSYIDAKVYRLEHYYNSGAFVVADSMLQLLLKEPRTNKRQLNLLKMYEALLQGNNGNTYKYLTEEYNIYPFDIETNSSTMTVALQYVNRPEDVTPMFDEISMKGMDLADCIHCEFRYYIQALAQIELHKTSEAIELLAPFAKTKDNRLLKETLIRAYVTSGNSETKVQDIISGDRLSSGQEQWRRLSLATGKEYQLVGEKQRADHYFDQVISSFDSEAIGEEEIKVLAYAHFYKGAYNEAAPLFEELIQSTSGKIPAYYSCWAISNQKAGKADKAAVVLQQLREQKNKYDYGQVDYALAQYHAAIGDGPKAIEYLFKAVASGRWYTPDAYQHDIFFKPYIGSKEFKEILEYWK